MKFVFILLTLCLSFLVQGQFQLSGEFRPRTEYGQGVRTLTKQGDDFFLWTTQRTRLIANYSSEHYSTKLVLQDVRVWGSQPQLVISDGLVSIHEAFVDWKMSEKFSLKLGRMELCYDDHRILGNVEWLQQARSHDLAILKYKNQLHLGAAWNQDSIRFTNNFYTVSPSYKAMQFAWYHLGEKEDDFNMSLLVLNNGLAVNDTINNELNQSIEYSQTLGGRFTYQAHSKLKLMSNLYYQTGKDGQGRNLNAFLINLDAQMSLSEKLTFTAGGEVTSGNDRLDNVLGVNTNRNNAFTPFYGTNHKFNGFMDYFYVGNHANSVGLNDFYLKSKISLGEKGKLIAAIHNFSTQNRLVDNNGVKVNSMLGNEVDLVYKRKMKGNVLLVCGYSHMFATESMEVLKGEGDAMNGGNSGAINHWAWVALTFRPKFL